MFLGHFGLGFGAKTLQPRISLGTLFLAAQFVDLLWPTLLLAGLERVDIVPGATVVTPLDFVSYPITHSLLMVVVWGMVVGGLFAAVRQNYLGAALVGGLVVSHWLLDLLVHRPDLPLFPGNSEMLGLGLWNSLVATLALEGLIFGAGVYLYSRTSRSLDKTGRYGLWSLVAFLVLVYVMNLVGNPPPSETAIAWVGQAQWLLVVWAYWVDKHRGPVRR